MESALVSRSSWAHADPLSSVLALLKPRGFMSGGVDAGGSWAFSFSSDGLFRCFAVISGGCWLSMPGMAEDVRLEAEDVVALPHGKPFILRGDSDAEPLDILSVIKEPLSGDILSWQGGGDCLALSALFLFSNEHARVLLEVLPPLVHIRSASHRAAMRWYLERMMGLLRQPEPGGALLAEHLAQMLLIEVLRLQVATGQDNRKGWLFAMSDPQIRKSLSAIHSQPGHKWSLQTLAEQAGMSRSVFAQRFKAKVGTSAMEYLGQWRMLIAADRLVHSDESVAGIALSLGYESESAFSFAFKRAMGCSPRQYGTHRDADPPVLP